MPKLCKIIKCVKYCCFPIKKIEEKVGEMQNMWKHTIYSGDCFVQSNEGLTLLWKLIEVSKSRFS